MSGDKINILCLDAKEGASLVDLDAVDFLLNAMEGMSIELDKDPLGGGPTRLQSKLATVRNMLSKLQRWYHIVSRADHTLGRSLLLINTELELREKDLLANDPDVKKPASHKDREAVAHYKMRTLFQEKYRLEAAVHDTTSVLRALSQKRTDLKDTISRLRDQVRLCQDELTLGRKWGSQVPESNLVITPEPRLSEAVSEDAEVTLAELLSENEGASLYDFEVPTRASLEESIQDKRSTPSDTTHIEFLGASFVCEGEYLVGSAESDSEVSLEKSILMTAASQQDMDSEEKIEDNPPDLAVPMDSALEELSMDVLDELFQEAQGVVALDTDAEVIEDGLPDDFWD